MPSPTTTPTPTAPTTSTLAPHPADGLATRTLWALTRAWLRVGRWWVAKVLVLRGTPFVQVHSIGPSPARSASPECSPRRSARNARPGPSGTSSAPRPKLGPSPSAEPGLGSNAGPSAGPSIAQRGVKRGRSRTRRRTGRPEREELEGEGRESQDGLVASRGASQPAEAEGR